MDNPQPSQLFSQLCDSTLHCVNYVVLFLYQQQILAYYKILIYNFSPTSLSDFKLLQKDLLSLFICYSVFFLIQIRVQATNKPVSQVLCLERHQSQTHFLRFETKLSLFFFFTVSRITYYFPIMSGLLFT